MLSSYFIYIWIWEKGNKKSIIVNSNKKIKMLAEVFFNVMSKMNLVYYYLLSFINIFYLFNIFNKIKEK